MSDAVYSADYRFESPTKDGFVKAHRERRQRNLAGEGRFSMPVVDKGIDLRSGRPKGITGWRADVERREAMEKRAAEARKNEVEKVVTNLAEGVVVRDWLDVSTKHRTAFIIQEVAAQFGLTVAELCSARRTAKLIAPRHIAMTLCKHLTQRSFPEIGRRIGMRDHTTVLHACRKYQPVLDVVAVHLPVQAPVSVWVATFKQEAEKTDIGKWQSIGKAVDQA